MKLQSKLKIREVKKEDILDIEALNKQQDFSIDTIDDYIIDRIVVENDKPIAYGIVKKMAEAIILVDKQVPKITRSKALIELMKVAIFGAKAADYSQLHVFVKDEKLACALEKHFGFKRAEDIVLVLNI
jgi:hypothetical protein